MSKRILRCFNTKVGDDNSLCLTRVDLKTVEGGRACPSCGSADFLGWRPDDLVGLDPAP